MNSELVFMSDSIDMMNRFNIDTIRVSKDSKVNSFGKQLIDFYKITICSYLMAELLAIKV